MVVLGGEVGHCRCGSGDVVGKGVVWRRQEAPRGWWDVFGGSPVGSDGERTPGGCGPVGVGEVHPWWRGTSIVEG